MGIFWNGMLSIRVVIPSAFLEDRDEIIEIIEWMKAQES